VAETKIEDGERVFQFSPCSMDCKYAKYAKYVIEESQRQNKSIKYRSVQ